MKKIMFVAVFIIPFLFGCGNANSNKDNAGSVGSAEKIEVGKEIKSIDTLKDVETVKEDIEVSTEKLDKLLNDL